jgi:hypothetical protein
MSIILTDANVHTFARACPHFHFIGLGNHDTPVSLGALSYIVGRCCELCEVSLCMDARLDALSTAPLDDDEQVHLQPIRRLMKLEIGESPIACVSPDPPTAPDLMVSILWFLHMIAPRLVELEMLTLGMPFEWTHQTDMETTNDIERWMMTCWRGVYLSGCASFYCGTLVHFRFYHPLLLTFST